MPTYMLDQLCQLYHPRSGQLHMMTSTIADVDIDINDT